MIHVYHQKISEWWFATAIEDDKILATAFSNSEKAATKQLLESLPFGKPFQTENKLSLLGEKAFGAFKSVLAGENVSLNLKLEQSHLSEYAQKVLGCLSKVPVGYVTTYGALAKAAGGGPRAVGQIMRLNPFAPLVPCHRVVRSDFSLGGYGGGVGEGVKVKRMLLEREDKGFKKPTKVQTDCGTIELFPVGFLWRTR